MNLKISLNNKPVEANEGETILDVAKRNGIEIPTFCHQKDLKHFTSCFVCAVEIEGLNRLVPSCATMVTDGMKIITDSVRAKETRRVCIELLLSDHVGDCHGPCEVDCPAGIDIPGFISLLASGRESDALKLIKETMPFPAALGRICPKPCEKECRRGLLEEPIAICYLKRFIADADLKLGAPYTPEMKSKSGKKVAIIGAGPAGLSAAFYLRITGHGVDIFDSHDEAGGMLRYGIPSYRMPRDVLAKEIGLIERMGVSISLNKKIGKDFGFKDLLQKYDAVMIAIGCQSSSEMGVEGENSEGVISGIGFLDNIACGNEIDLGNNVIVVGGGNTAIDCARTAVRLGVKGVTILYRRTKKEMPADETEIIGAEEEGVKFEYLAAPVKIERRSDRLVATCIRMELGAPDSSGRQRPVPIKGSEFELNVSTIISAIGQKTDTDTLGVTDAGVQFTKWKTILVDPNTLQTNNPKVFSAGDCVIGADIAVRAVEGGRRAAVSIDQFLKGEKVIGPEKRYHHFISKKKSDVPNDIAKKITEKFEEKKRTKMTELSPDKRRNNFDEIEKGYNLEKAVDEAKRCFSCGCRSYESCDLRKLAEITDASQERFIGSRRVYHIDESHEKIRYESHKCILCGSCVRVCSEVKGLDALGFVWRGFSAFVRPQMERPWKLSSCDACLKCVPMCPTGAISMKVTPADTALSRMDKGIDASKDVE